MEVTKTYDQLTREINHLRLQLEEANETIDAIRTGQIDAIIVHGNGGHELYTLKSADQTYRVFIEKMTEGAVTLNQDGIILYSNSQFAAMVNMPLSKVTGLPFASFIISPSKEHFNQLFESGWIHDSKGEVDIISGDGFTSVQLSLTTLQLDEGMSLSIILTDLTLQKDVQQQLKLNNEQLAAANHALELSNIDLQQFASVASHDLQEPLRKIQMFSMLIKTKFSDQMAPDSRLFLDKVINASDRMKSLIVDILNYSQLSADNNGFELLDLQQLIKDLLDDFEVIIQEKKAVITIGNLSFVEGNYGQMRQVFQNLISNALKFSKKDEPLRMNFTAKKIATLSYTGQEQHDGPFCYISVTDNGIGFDQQYASNIFTLFQRLHSKDSYEGTGIGLAIAKKIIDKHHGLVKANGKEDKGAEFIIVLPVHQKRHDR